MNIHMAISICLAALVVALVVVGCLAIVALNRIISEIKNLKGSHRSDENVKFMGPGASSKCERPSVPRGTFRKKRKKRTPYASNADWVVPNWSVH